MFSIFLIKEVCFISVLICLQVPLISCLQTESPFTEYYDSQEFLFDLYSIARIKYNIFISVRVKQSQYFKSGLQGLKELLNV